VFTLTGAYLAEQRRARHLNSHELARLVGYDNLTKGARRILALERDGVTVPGLLDKIVDALLLDRDHVFSLMDEDRREFQAAWEQWADEPVPPQLRRRWMAAVWGRVPMPTGLTRGEAVEFAQVRAVEEERTFVLIWSRREEIWIYPTGETYERRMNFGDVAGPVMRLRGHGERGFVFG
jgi:hypothetical protein